MENNKGGKVFKKVLVIDDTEMDLKIAQMAMNRYSFADEIILKKSAVLS